LKKILSTDLTEANLRQVLQLLSESPARLERICQDSTAEQARQPLGPGERSVTEVLAHLINGEAWSSEMIYMALLVDQPHFYDLHPDRSWGKLLRFDLLDFDELLAYFKTRRKVLLGVLAALPFEKWSRAVEEEGKQRRESVYWRARTILMHELDHLADLEAKLGSSR
jgi:hypothetical protein